MEDAFPENYWTINSFLRHFLLISFTSAYCVYDTLQYKCKSIKIHFKFTQILKCEINIIFSYRISFKIVIELPLDSLTKAFVLKKKEKYFVNEGNGGVRTPKLVRGQSTNSFPLLDPLSLKRQLSFFGYHPLSPYNDVSLSYRASSRA